MAYCRLSSRNPMCDVYTYANVRGGWTTHVASNREIGLPFDGESFNDPTPGECAGRLEWLREVGYNVPQHAIDALKAEEAEGVVGLEDEPSAGEEKTADNGRDERDYAN